MKDQLKLLAFSALILGAALGASVLFPVPFKMLLILSFYFTFFTYLFNLQLQKAYDHENKNKFTQVYMGFTGIKMLSCLVLLVCFLYFFKDNKLNIGIFTMSYYMLYTIFEVILWKGKLRP